MINTSRRFHLQRNVDATGTSGIGFVAVGCEFPNGWCSLTWLTLHTSVAFYPSIEALEHIHGHSGSTLIVWDDPPTTPPPEFAKEPT